MTALQMERSHVELGLAPAADAFAGTVTSDVVSLKNHHRVRFIIVKGVGATGTSTITVEACDDVVPTTTAAVPFRYRRTVAGAAPGAITAAAAAGFVTTAGSAEMYEVEIDQAALVAAGYSFARLKAVEVVDSPVLGGILIEMLDPKVSANSPVTATT